MDRPVLLSNRSISNCHSDSSESYSVSTLGSKFSTADSSYSYYNKSNGGHLSQHLSQHRSNKNKAHPSTSSSNHERSSTNSSGLFKSKMPAALSRIQRRRNKANNNNNNDRLSVTLHTSESDIGSRRGPRAGLDRQHSISRWMADAVSEQCGKIRRAVSSHESLLTLTTSASTSTFKRPISPPEMHKSEHPVRENAPFRLFRRANSHMTLSKPVRKRSSGPEGLLKDVLMALSGHERKDAMSRFRPFGGVMDNSDNTPLDGLDDNDIEEEDTDEEDVEFHTEEVSEAPTPMTTSSAGSTLAPLLMDSLRWNASSPSQEKQKDIPPIDRLLRCSSKTMPVPPPPPFSPVTSRSGIDAVPNDLFQPGRCGLLETAKPDPDEREDEATTSDQSNRCSFSNYNNNSDKCGVTQNHLRESLTSQASSASTPLAPLAAASAAIAIATDSMNSLNGDTFEEEEGCLNDLVDPPKRSLHADSGSDEDLKTDAATGGSDHTGRDSWQDSEISLDGVSMLSASNTSFHYSTHKSSQSFGFGLAGGNSSTGLAAYMNKIQRDVEERKASRSKNKGPDLGSYMNKVKRIDEEKSNKKDLSYKSTAEDTFESAYTFATDGFEEKSPMPVKAALPPPPPPIERLPLKASSDHHPFRRNPSIVPPSMPKRSVSHHEKKDIAPTAPAQSPSDRVQRLLDINQQQIKYTPRAGRRSSLPENVNTGTNMRFRRRVSMEHQKIPGTSIVRRRASLDSSISNTGGMSSYHNRRAFLTQSVTNTPRTSPSISRHRKNIEDFTTPENSCHSFHNRTPTNTRNLTTAPPAPCLRSRSPSLRDSALRDISIKEENETSFFNDSGGDDSDVLMPVDSSDRWKAPVDVPLSTLAATR